MKYPKFLSKGNIIGVPAPSNGASDEDDIIRYKNAIAKFEEAGYKVNVSNNLFNGKNARSSDAKTRGEEMNEFFKNDTDFLICATGGEFLIECLSYVDFDLITSNPKWIMGFSDPTGILFPITTKYDIATLYGNNFKTFGMRDYHKSVKDSLEIMQGNLIKQESYNLYEDERNREDPLCGYNLTEKVYWKSLDGKEVHVKGRIIAGCLDIIMELAGTKFDGMADFNERYKEDGIILCLDNCELSKEELIRSMWKLNELGYFKYAKAIIFGRNGYDFSSLGYTMETCLKDSVLKDLDIPIVYDSDISHRSPCMTIINGSIVDIYVNNGKATVEFKLE